MVESMTGFACFEKELFDKKITIEIKSLNSKYIDISFRLPSVYSYKEGLLRKKIGQFLKRGKIEVTVHLQNLKPYLKRSINTETIRSYMDEIKKMVPGFEEIRYFELAMKMPDALSTLDKIPDEQEWHYIEHFFDEALTFVKQAREEEGKILGDDLLSRVEHISQLISGILPFEQERKQLIEKKIKKQFNTQDIQIDTARLDQELLFYLEKIDITEERVRLNKHCDYFTQVLTQEESQGRKLNFIAQEIFREINTLGVKAQHIEIQKSTILMKEELEKIREQLANIL